MLSEISLHLNHLLHQFTPEDDLLLQGGRFPFEPQRFQLIIPSSEEKTIAFIDGGQAEILSAANFTVSFIRVYAQIFSGLQKKSFTHLGNWSHEFFVITSAHWENNSHLYKSKILSKEPCLIEESQLLINSQDPLLKIGKNYASPAIVSSLARRFAELALANKITNSFAVLDGTLEAVYPGEEQLLSRLGNNVSALAKSSSLLTMKGNNPAILLYKYGPLEPWYYPINEKTCFVKLHPQAKHVFRFEGTTDVLPHLLPHAADALFLGYPYGLICADKLARVSSQEQKSLFLRLLLRAENKEIKEYLTTLNAHSILDALG